MQGRLIDVSFDFNSNRQLVTFEVVNTSPEELNRLAEIDLLDIEAKKHRERRSLSANAYFHVLSGKIADALTISKAHAKNLLITKYGQRMYAGETLACVKSNLTIEQVQEMEEPHLKFVKYNEEEEAYYYYIYRGSHTYDSNEMAKLIDGTIADANELGIDTLTPEEIAKLK